LSFDLSGSDSDVFQAPAEREIELTGRLSKVPAFDEVTMSVTRRTATFTVTETDTMGIFYFQIELRNIDSPTPKQIVDNFEEGKSLRVNTISEFHDVTWTVEGLAASTEYTLFLCLQDLSDNYSALRVVPFETVADHSSVQFVIDFTELKFNGKIEDLISGTIIPEVGHAISVVQDRVRATSI
jgi:hypothetical protein